MPEFSNHHFAHTSLTESLREWPGPQSAYPPLGELNFDFNRAEVWPADVPMSIESIAGVVQVNEGLVSRATMSFKSYRMDRDVLDSKEGSDRALLFCTNGGPISAATGWVGMELYEPSLHEPTHGGIHPLFSLMRPIDHADVVYVDPPGTGYGRALEGTSEDYFFGVERDARLMTEFLKSYREAYNNTGKIFLMGCSYAAFRTAAMANMLLDEGEPLAGLISISGGYDYKLIAPSETRQYAQLTTLLYLPTFAVTALYHQRMTPDSYEFYRRDEVSVYNEAAAFAWGAYADAVRHHRRLSPAEQKRFSDLTGMPRAFLEERNFTIDPEEFSTALLRAENLRLSRVDARYAYAADKPFSIDPLLDDEGDSRLSELREQFWMIDPESVPGGYRFNLNAYPRWPFAGEWGQRDLYATYKTILERTATPITEINGIYDLLASPEHRQLFWEALLPETGWELSNNKSAFFVPKGEDRTVNRYVLPTGHQPAINYLQCTDVSTIINEAMRHALGKDVAYSEARARQIGQLLVKRDDFLYPDGVVG